MGAGRWATDAILGVEVIQGAFAPLAAAFLVGAGLAVGWSVFGIAQGAMAPGQVPGLAPGQVPALVPAMVALWCAVAAIQCRALDRGAQVWLATDHGAECAGFAAARR